MASKKQLPVPSWDIVVVALQDEGGMTQSEIAGQVGSSQNFISDLRNKKRQQCEWPIGLSLYSLYAKRVLKSELRLVPVRR